MAMMYDPNVHDEVLPDPYGGTQFEQTQQASQSQDGIEPWDCTVWGALKPLHHSHARITLKKDVNSLSIGRAHENDFKLRNLKISNKHCELSWDPATSGDSTVTVLDKSSNGTFINGHKIGRNMSAMLMDGNEIAFGQWSEMNTSDNFRYIFRYLADGPPKNGIHKYYDIGRELGRGSFATVRRGVCRADGTIVALKMINRNKLRTDGKNAASMFMKEIEILEKLHHPNICRLREAFHEDENIILVLEYVDGGDLLDHIVNRDGLSEDEARRLAFQLCKALKYIHAKGIAHRDLKPENILLTRDEPPILKIADFGLAKAVDSMTRFKTTCGTPIYLAPEVILRNTQESYSHMVDSWSAGVIIFAMIANANPFVDDDASIMTIRFRSRYIDWGLLEDRNISTECREFLERLLEENPQERMSCGHALKDPWLAELATGDPEALEDIPNDSFVSVQANAGSFLDQAHSTPLPLPPPTLPEASQPRSQDLRAGISSDFRLFRVHESAPNEDASSVSPVSVTTAGTDPCPNVETEKSQEEGGRSQGRGLQRRAMQIAEYDNKGQLVSFQNFPNSLFEAGPIYVQNPDSNANGKNEQDNAAPDSPNAGSGKANGSSHNGQNGSTGAADATSEPSLVPVTENSGAISEVASSKAKKRSASSDAQDADICEEAPSKRSRAVTDVAAA